MRILLLTVFVCIACAASSQQDTLSDLETLHFYTRNSRADSSSLTPTQILSRNRLNNLNAVSVAEAARYFAGVQLKDYGGIGGLKTISVRSLGANHTGITYDGIVLNDAQNAQVDLGKFTLENIDAVSLYNGYAGDLLQPARIYSYASLIRLQTLSTVIPGERHWQYAASFKTGSFGLLHPSLTIKNKSGRFSSSFHTDYLKATGNYNFSYKNVDKTVHDRRANSDVAALNMAYTAHFKLNDSNAIQANLYYYDGQRGLPGSIILYTQQGSQRLWDKQFFAQATWYKSIHRNLQFFIGAKYNTSYYRYIDTAFFYDERILENIFYQDEAYTTAVLVYKPFDFLKISYASDYFINNLRSNDTAFGGPMRHTWLNNISVHFSKQRWSFAGNILSTTVKDKRLEFTGHTQELTPTVAVNYTLSQKDPLIVRAFYKNIFRMPTFNDLYYTHIGNTRLRPEYTHQYNAGLLWNKHLHKAFVNNISVTADVYYNHIHDKIIAIPSANIAQWSMQNIGQVSVKGADIQAYMHLKPIGDWLLSLMGSYTWQQSLDVTDATSALYKNQIAYTPLHSGSFNFSAIYGKLNMAYNALFSGYRYTAGMNSAFTYLPAWNTHDISVSRKWGLKRVGTYKLVFELSNIWNHQYAIVNYYPMPGRHFRLAIHWSK